jgi:hypothetical protein
VGTGYRRTAFALVAPSGGKAWAAMVNHNHPDAARYMKLAAEAYRSARMMTDAASQAIMIKIASAYMRLARLVREREREDDGEQTG